MISWIDRKVGEVLQALATAGLADDTLVVVAADHGDMLGERGLWFKMSFRDGAARVPLMLAAPGLAPGRRDHPVSLLDVLPTLADIAGVDAADVDCDGESLLAPGPRGPVAMEYAAEGSVAPMVGLRDGRWKLVLCDADPPQLFDLEADPAEARDLAADPAHAGTLDRLVALARARWDLARFDREVRKSQARRRIVYEALRQGAYTPWDFQPCRPASERYMRNHMDLNVLEAEKRYPPPVSGN
jgi:choline-sulfatase